MWIGHLDALGCVLNDLGPLRGFKAQVVGGMPPPLYKGEGKGFNPNFWSGEWFNPVSFWWLHWNVLWPELRGL